MNCKECERIIYLFEESTDNERRMMEEHIGYCESCSKLFEELRTTNALIQDARQVMHPANPTALTGKIMNALPAGEPGQRWLQYLLEMFDLSTVRYSMAIVSVMLVLLFITEIPGPNQRVYMHSSVPSRSAGVVLSSGSLRQDFLEYRRQRTSLLDCMKQLHNKIDLQCLKEKMEKSLQ